MKVSKKRGIPRRLAVLILSEQRNRLQNKPLHVSLISHWAADLDFQKGIREFSKEQMELLGAVNLHYASGGSRAELLQKIKEHKLNVCS